MPFKDVTQWNKRAAALYAFGAWTLLGSLVFNNYTGKFNAPTGPEENEEVQEPEDVNKVTHTTAHTHTVATYKKDFVPYNMWLCRLFSSHRAEPGTGGDDGDDK
ncbi:small integral membrane protein 26 [Labrus bergylta]|uniref:small integral membrane protein 26 n=1 Tax=Labrus bergylta TaxID=56723 RepID=UPI003313A2A2